MPAGPRHYRDPRADAGGAVRPLSEAEKLEAFEDAARAAHGANRAYCITLGDDSQPIWDRAPQWQRDSAILGVKFVWYNGVNPAAQHECWVKEKRRDGWVYGPEKDVIAKTHPCLVPYAELPAEQRVKDVIFGAVADAVLRAFVARVALPRGAK